MRVVVLDGPKKLSVVEKPTPQADGKKVIIKISKVGICGSDLHMWEKGERVGLVMEHEFSGTVVDAGLLKDSLKVGDRVTALPLDPCLKCVSCLKGDINMCLNPVASPGIRADGAYAEFFACRPDMIRKLPDSISDDEATMLEPAAVTLRAVRNAGIKPGDKVLINGGGIIGLLSAAWARFAGASYIALTEANKTRGENAAKMADIDAYFDATDPEMLNKLLQGSGGGFDQAIDCTAVPSAINNAIMAMNRGGRIILAGVSYKPIPINTLVVVLREIEFKGTIAYSHEFDKAMDIIGSKRLNTERFISGTIELDGAQAAFEKLTAGTYPDVKILIRP
ncbi:MAG TPA: alcohol dehydrogenase catalytic domain-containing protein [Desulfosporosinus sp.]|nr:alcohol dehydrogenase catalytic domain-containing protein [Desulfosporosinus sp.]